MLLNANVFIKELVKSAC